MRPILLKMTAFGPYPNETVIDFTELKDNNIFVITGPTGSGKTTIFDAICYALYGETSGNTRTGRDLRSHFVDIEGAKTEVEFTFSVKDREYYIKRTPMQERRKKKGEGTIEDPAAVEFKELNSPKPPLTKADKVNTAIENVIGIKADQFRKIVMIPQGDFREFLSANTTVKEEILRKIFSSEYYKRFQERLIIKASNLSKEVISLKTKIQENIQLIDTGSNEQLAEKITGNAPIQEIIELLDEFIKEEKKLKDREENEKKVLNDTIEKETREYGKQLEVNKKFEDKEKYEAALLQLESRKAEMTEKEGRKQKAERAQNLIPYETSLNERINEKNTILREQENEKANLQKAETAQSQAEEEKKKADGFEKTVEDLNRQLVILNGYVKDAEALDEKEKAIASLKAQHAELNNIISGNKKKIDAMENELDYMQAKEKEKADLSLKLEKLNNDFKEIDNLHLICRSLYQESKQYSDNLKNINEKKVLKQNLDEVINAEIKSLETKRDIFGKSSAIILAKQLREGEPCPVCGSVHHPAPNIIEDEIPTENEIKEMDGIIRRKQLELSELSTQIGTLEGKQSILHASINQKFEQLKEKGWFSGEDALDFDNAVKPAGIKMANEKNNISKELQNVINRVKMLELELKDLEAKKKGLKNLKQKIETDNKLFLDVSTNLSKEEESLKGIYDRVPEEYRELNKLKIDISNFKEKAYNMSAYIKKAADNYNNSKTAFEKLKERVEVLNRNHIKSNEALQKAQDEFNANVINVFGSMEAYKGAKLGKEEIRKLDEELKQYRENVSVIGAHVIKLSEELTGLVKSDIKAIEALISQHKNELEEKINHISRVDGRLARNKDILKSIENNYENIRQKEAKYSIIGALARMANGNAEEKVSFETFVLASYFDDVILKANKRLQKMTSGRYYLMRKDEGKGGGRKGLDLDIYDNYTGKSRPVSTLSGGESFKASLALALGLSDEVQENSGGVELNTMFIDEGFGTLDSESLDYAINILMELQKNGRLVAVISHVNELKERIPAKLVVEMSLSGSRARFAV